MSDDRFEQWLKDAAEDYNRPPARVPREEMWAAIRATERSTTVANDAASGGGTPVIDLASRRRRVGPRFTGWTMAAAAVLLVALGIGIGRWMPRMGSTSGSTIAQNTPSATPGGDTAGSPDSAELAPLYPSSTRPPVVGPDVRTMAELEANGNAGTSYQLATIQHLTQAEALLTAFHTAGADRQADAELAAWARELLSSTRLLLDSPAARDPLRRRLLEDLELVLVQMVQLSPDAAPRDRELIERTLENGHVMTRLRTAIPAGPTSGT